MRENQLFWTREVYARILFQQLRSPREAKGAGKFQGVYQAHLKSSPTVVTRAEANPKGGRPSGWPSTRLPFEAFLQSLSCLPSPCEWMDLQWGSLPGQVLQQRNLEASWDLELTAHRDQRAVSEILRMTSRTWLRKAGPKARHRFLCQRQHHNFPIQPIKINTRGRRLM